MWLYFSIVSKIHFMREITGVYRVLSNSASHASTVDKRIQFITSIYELQNFFIQKYQIICDLNSLTRELWLGKLNIYAKGGRWREYMQLWWTICKRHPAFLMDIHPYQYLCYFFIPLLRKRHW